MTHAEQPRTMMTLTGSVEFTVDRLVAAIVVGVVDGFGELLDPARVADLVIDGLVRRGVGIQRGDDRNGPFVPPAQMPPRGTVQWGEYGQGDPR